MKIPFSEKELEVVAKIPAFMGAEMDVYNFPVSTTEGIKAAYLDKEPVWMPLGIETGFFCPSVIPDHVARGFCFEAVPVPREKFGGKDMFGINWKYIDVAGGSMSEGYLFDDVNDWKEHIDFAKIRADVDSWDWEGSAAMNKEYLASGPKILWMLNGCWFERLISFMTFEGAAMALMDEEQEDALHELLHETTSLYMYIFDKCIEHYDIPGICVHDDWGSQMAPFFSDDAARTFFLPEMKRFVDHVHSKGKFFELHSCGKAESRCDIFVEAGFDAWTPMGMNDTAALYEKWGDKICISVIPNELENPAAATEEEMEAAGYRFGQKYAKPGTTAAFSYMYGAEYATNAFRKGVYKASREAYSK